MTRLRVPTQPRRAALRLCTALAAPALMLAALPAAHAQTVDLDEVVISALRTEAGIRATGVSVGVIDRAAIEADGRTSLAEILADQPGLTAASSGPFGSTNTVRIRGAGKPYVAVFIDGIRVDDPSEPQAGFDFGALMASDIGRVEILRGSQSALWGSAAVGGVISITTLGAIEEGLNQQVQVEAGSHRTVRLGYGLTQKTGALEMALNLSRLRTDGFSAAAAGKEKDGADAMRLSFSARYRVSDTLAVGGAYFIQKTDQDYDSGYTLGGVFTDSGARSERLERGARLFAELSTGATEHVFDIAWYDVDRKFIESWGNNGFAGNRLSAGWQATTDLSQGLTLVYGLDWSQEEARYTNIAGGKADRSIYGAFGQAIWAPSEQLDVSLALRADQDSDFGTFLSGRLAGAWHISPDTTLRAAIARGYRAPTLDERFADYNYGIPTVGNPDLDPETSLSYEIGLDHGFAGGASLSATLFRLEIENRIGMVTRVDGGGMTYQTADNLSGTSVSQGIELAGSLPLGDRTRLGLAYTHTDARAAGDSRLSGVPRNNLTLTLDSSLTDRLSAGLRLTHVSGLRSAGGNAPYLPVDLDPFTLLDARLSYDLNDRTNLYLRIENLTDQDYQVVDAYGTSGRAVYVGLRTKF